MTTFETEIIGTKLVVRPLGRLDLVSAPQLRDIITSSVANGVVGVVVALQGVAFMD